MSRARAPNLRRALAKNLRRLRAEREWTQERAADQVGLNARHFQKLEEGSVNVTLRTLEALCVGFGVDAADLFDRAGPT